MLGAEDTGWQPHQKKQAVYWQKDLQSDSTAGALAVTGSGFCIGERAVSTPLCSTLMLSVLRNFLHLHPFRTLLITFYG